MRYFILIIVLGFSFADTILFNQAEESTNLSIISDTNDSITMDFRLNRFSFEDVYINGTTFNKISIDDEPVRLELGQPELPHINRSIIIPDLSSSNVRIISSQYRDYNDFNIVPSKGNVKRNVNINDVPYITGPEYDSDVLFPYNLVELHSPYILRDYRGQVVQFNPIQYNPVTGLLRVYFNITVAIDFTSTENNIVNPFDLNKKNKTIHEYSGIYTEHFINYNARSDRYTPIAETGEMLIICYDDFVNEMQDFVSWKNQIGIKTTIVPRTSVGNNASSISSYVDNYYNNHNLGYLLLVGDKSQIPTITIGGDESDISYAYISGNDHYPEFFVGRFSAQNTYNVATQVERTIEYERNPQQGQDWYKKGLMIASNEGAGYGHDGGEADWQHARNMRQDLLSYTYSQIDEFYDGSHSGNDQSGNPSDTMIKNSINSGRGIIHYTGHGDTDLWVTSGFTNTDVNQLTNDNELPFVCTVGCKSGDFGGTCLGESFLRATNNNEPTGAIATFMSTIYQGWAPPMEAQDEMVDILTEQYSNNRKFTFGGISTNGTLKMNDAYGNSGYTETDHWILFGDPSVLVRTDTPSTFSIDHTGVIDLSISSYTVSMSSVSDYYTAALSYNGEFISAASSNENVISIPIDYELYDGQALTLTVSGYNMVPVIENVIVGSGCQEDGDLSDDGIINILDIVLIVNYVLNLDNPGFCQEASSDLNNDGIINIMDVILLVNLVLNT